MKRRLLATTALAGLAALAACSPAQLATASADLTKVATIVAGAGPYIQMAGTLIGALYPPAAPIIALATAALTEVEPVFATINASLTVAKTQTAVGQIATGFDTATGFLQQAINEAPPSAGLAKYQPYVTQATAIVQMLTAFAATGALPTPAPAAPTAAILAQPTVPVKMWGL
jgi:hypothetical protein